MHLLFFISYVYITNYDYQEMNKRTSINFSNHSKMSYLLYFLFKSWLRLLIIMKVWWWKHLLQMGWWFVSKPCNQFLWYVIIVSLTLVYNLSKSLRIQNSLAVFFCFWNFFDLLQKKRQKALQNVDTIKTEKCFTCFIIKKEVV